MKIPKRMSFFWSGGPLSWMRYMSLWSFRLLNPDWEMVLYLDPRAALKPLWTTGEVQDCDPPMQCEDHIGRLAAQNVKIEPFSRSLSLSPVRLADQCRWHVLSRFGGWFADTDMLFVDSMANIYAQHDADVKKREANLGVAGDDGPRDCDVAMPLCRDWIPTGLIGAVPETRFAVNLDAAGRHAPNLTRYASAGRELIARMCGLPDPTMPAEKKDVVRGLKASFPGVNFYIMHHLTAYRWEWFDANRIFDQDEEVLPACIAIHWYAGSRAGQKFNRKYDEKNFRQDKNTFTHYAADLIDGAGG